MGQGNASLYSPCHGVIFETEIWHMLGSYIPSFKQYITTFQKGVGREGKGEDESQGEKDRGADLKLTS